MIKKYTMTLKKVYGLIYIKILGDVEDEQNTRVFK